MFSIVLKNCILLGLVILIIHFLLKCYAEEHGDRTQHQDTDTERRRARAREEGTDAVHLSPDRMPIAQVTSNNTDDLYAYVYGDKTGAGNQRSDSIQVNLQPPTPMTIPPPMPSGDLSYGLPSTPHDGTLSAYNDHSGVWGDV